MKAFTTLRSWFDDVLVQPEGWAQFLILIAIVLFAFVLRTGLSYWLRRLRTTSRHKLAQSVLDGSIYLLPLATPLLTLILTGVVYSALSHDGIPVEAFPIAGKLFFGWLLLQGILLFVKSAVARVFCIIVIGGLFMLDVLELLNPAIEASQGIQYKFGKIKVTLYGVLSSLLALIVLLWLAGAVQRGSERVLGKLSIRGSTRQLLLKTLTIALYCIVGLIALSILGVDVTALTVFGGALGVGIGFGLQKIASNFVSGIILLMERSIEVNDQITLESGLTGYVRRTGARYTLVDTDDGRACLIPNEQFITQRVINLTYAGRKGKLDLRTFVAYEADLNAVRAIMLAAVKAHPYVSPTPEPTCFIAAFKEGYVEMVSYFWVSDITKGTAAAKTEIWMAILEQFRQHHVPLPTPFATRYLSPEGSYTRNATAPGAETAEEAAPPQAESGD